MKILIVDDHTLFREGLRLLLTALGDSVVIDQAGSIPDAIQRATHHAAVPVDLILLDIDLPGISGLDGLTALLKKFDGAPVVLLSGMNDPTVIREGLARGARGFICKSVKADVLLESVRCILTGGTLSPENPPVSPSVVVEPARFTPRQREVLFHLCEGKSNKEIACCLGMSENTVRTHITVLFQALGVRTRTEAAAVARSVGLA